MLFRYPLPLSNAIILFLCLRTCHQGSTVQCCVASRYPGYQILTRRESPESPQILFGAEHIRHLLAICDTSLYLRWDWDGDLTEVYYLVIEMLNDISL